MAASACKIALLACLFPSGLTLNVGVKVSGQVVCRLGNFDAMAYVFDTGNSCVAGSGEIGENGNFAIEAQTDPGAIE